MSSHRIIIACMVARFLFVICCVVLVFSRLGRGELKNPVTPEPKSYEKNYPPIIEMSFKGDVVAVQKLLFNDADPNARAFDNSTAIQFVCRNGDDTFEIEVAKELFKAGARARVSDNSNNTPLHQVSAVALFKNRNELIMMLFLHGADMNARTALQDGGGTFGAKKRDYTLLDMLVNNFDRTGVIDFLENWGGLIPKEERAKSRALAYDLGMRDIADAIDAYREEKKGWVRNLESRGLTKLMIAALTDDLDLVRKQIKQKDVISNDVYKRTALHLAVMRRSPRVAQLLLDAGANAMAKDYCGNTPLHMVAWLGGDSGVQQELTQLLIKYGTKVEQLKVRNEDRKDNILQRAVRLRDLPYVQYLVNTFTHDELAVTEKNFEGLTAWYLAEKLNLKEMMKIIPKK